MYDPQLGRFFTQDRFAEKYFSFNPYHYTLNNPVNSIDVNGDWVKVKVKRSAREELEKQGTNIEDYLKNMYSDEYGISVNVTKLKKGKYKYKVESSKNQDGYDSENGTSESSGLSVSESARGDWINALDPDKKSKGKIVFKSGQGSNAGFFGGFARIHLNQTDGWDFGEIPSRTMNMARLMEHEYLAHVVGRKRDITRKNMTTGEAVDQVNVYRNQMGLPERETYTGERIVDRTNQTTILRINFNISGKSMPLIIPISFSRLDKYEDD